MRWPSRDKVRSWWLACVLLGVLCFSWPLYSCGGLELRVVGQRATAEILERGVRRVHERIHSHLDDFVVRVAFTDRVGQRQEALVSLSRAVWSAAREGGVMLIAYDPAAPARAVAVAGMSQVDRDLWARAAWGIPLLLLGLWLRSRRFTDA